MLVLEADELERITRRRRPAAQARILRMLGVPFARHPVDGTILVATTAAARALGDNASPASDQAPAAVNVEALRARGEKARNRGRG